ncbi:EF-hand domain-containing protein [uncultured Marivita sp.]|uniref:EF-hand domain-containing protein n=1 Tax=uncultured Marivita sp. TaxID=888080 RepID=UPI002610C2D1|nr:EF-hand domain-containing protein [uncultured Marivita sp.]
MKSSKALPIGFLVLALAGTGAMVATAQTAPVAPDALSADAQMTRADMRGDRDGRGGRDGHRGGHRGGGFGGEMFRTVFDAADADGDGSVTQAEIDAYRAAQIGAVDASGDGALSIEEFDELYRSFTRSRMVDAFQSLDSDGDGQIAPEELDTRIARMVERLDRDGDGALTLQRRSAPQGDN